MKITCIGGGPAGLYLSILMKLADRRHEIDLFERNPRGNTFGWGVVLSDETLRNLRRADPVTATQISDTLAHWDDIDVCFKGRVIRSSGHGFCGIGRQELLNILSARAEDLGVRLHFDKEVDDYQSYIKSNDLVVASDGIFSSARTQFADQFKPDIEQRTCKFIWLGVKKIFPAFTFIFKETKYGWFQAHCYRFNSDTSTFIVECPESVWKAAGIDRMSKEDGVVFCESIFSEHLDGQRLISNTTHLRGSGAWITFQRVICQAWHFKNLVLLGDSAASAHFTIGSGTKLALEDAISLANVLNGQDSIDSALQKYEEVRRVEVLKLQSAARNSTEWFESVRLREELEPEQFAYSLLTRSQRVSHENLRLRDRDYLEEYEKWFSRCETGLELKNAVPPMFVPLKLRSLKLVNRVAVSPMAMYSAIDGMPSDFHLVHFGSLALGGAGLIFTEMTNVSAEARITPGCAGIYNNEHVLAWKRIVDFVHGHSPAKFAMQLGHAGPKGSTKLGWEGMDEPLNEGNWPILAPSPIRYADKNQTPREMTRMDMDLARDQFVQATMRAEAAGFDMLELHCAHGYLLSAFISPLTNKRSDDYGGSLINRLRFPLEIFAAMRNVWPEHKPMSVRISACDWVDGGTTAEDAVKIARAFHDVGADVIDCSSGQVSKDQKPVYGRMYQTPFADRIRNEVKIKTMAVGNIFEPDHVNSIVAAGRADLCLLARPHLADPHWTLRAAAQLGYKDQAWPKQYDSAKRQLETNISRANEAGKLASSANEDFES